MVSRDTILAALKECYDPELGIDIVNLGLIYNIAVEPDRVKLTMTLTTPGCPLVPYFRQTIIRAVQKAAGASTVDLELTFDPPWDPSKMSAEARRQLTLMR